MDDWLETYLGKAQDAFDIFDKQIFERGELDRMTKDYIAVAASTVMRCESCVTEHVERLKEQDATDEEIAAALGVAWLTTGSTQIYWMEETYEELLGKSWYKRHLADASKAFGQFHEAIFDDSVLGRKTVELIGLGVSVVARCQHCTEAHAKQAMNNGASKQEVAEAIGVAWHVGAKSQVGWTDVVDDILTE